jgi:hypothetical protein
MEQTTLMLSSTAVLAVWCIYRLLQVGRYVLSSVSENEQ